MDIEKTQRDLIYSLDAKVGVVAFGLGSCLCGSRVSVRNRKSLGFNKDRLRGR